MTKAKFVGQEAIDMGTAPFVVSRQQNGLYVIKNTKTGELVENGVAMNVRNQRPAKAIAANKYYYSGYGMAYATPNLAHALCEAHLLAGIVKLGHQVATVGYRKVRNG